MTTKRKELCTTNVAACKVWNTNKMVLTITHNQFAAAINDVYYTILDNPTKGLNTIDLCTLAITSSPPTPRSANLIWMTT